MVAESVVSSLLQQAPLLFGVGASAATIFGTGWKVGRAISDRDLRNQLETQKLKLASMEDRLKKQRNTTKTYKDKIKEIERISNGEIGFWLRSPTFNIDQQATEINNSIPIITIANFKGGVGKTTLAANLCAYFERVLGKSVLLIDFDYQGSLSDSVLPHEKDDIEFSANLLIEGISPERALPHSTRLHPKFQKARIFPAFYTLNRVENRILFSWLSQPNQPDIRFNTHKILASQLIQDNFDVVIVDAPPRLMTATVNAVCASTHILIPTMPDNLCVNATLNTVGVVRDLKKNLCTSLEILGVVPTMVLRSSMNAREKLALRRLSDELPSYWNWPPAPHIFENEFISRREGVARAAGYEIAFDADDEAREMFSRLGAAIAKRIFHAGEGTQSRPLATGGDALGLAG